MKRGQGRQLSSKVCLFNIRTKNSAKLFPKFPVSSCNCCHTLWTGRLHFFISSCAVYKIRLQTSDPCFSSRNAPTITTNSGASLRIWAFSKTTSHLSSRYPLRQLAQQSQHPIYRALPFSSIASSYTVLANGSTASRRSASGSEIDPARPDLAVYVFPFSPFEPRRSKVSEQPPS